MSKIDLTIDTFQAIFFDFDGVLAECMDIKTDAFVELFQSYGEDIVKKVVKHHIENGGISRFKKIKYYYDEYLNIPISDKKVNEIAQRFSKLVIDKVTTSDWVIGAKEFLEQHCRFIDLFIVSGTPQDELRLIVKKRGMEKYFKGVYGSPDTKPAIVRRIIEENRYNCEKLLYIGDSLSDYYGVKEAGVEFLGRIPKGVKSIFPDDIPVIKNFLELL